MSFRKKLLFKKIAAIRERLVIPFAAVITVIIYAIAVNLASTPKHFLDFVLLEPGTTGKIFNFYSMNLRTPFFTGFLTLGGFLMSAKTFIIVNMKKEVYDTPGYKSEWTDGLKLDGPINYQTLFYPLRQLSNVIFWTIAFSFLTAVSQLTFGLVPTVSTVMICLFLVVATVTFLMLALYLIKKNLAVMFEHIDKNSKELIEDEKTKGN